MSSGAPEKAAAKWTQIAAGTTICNNCSCNSKAHFTARSKQNREARIRRNASNTWNTRNSREPNQYQECMQQQETSETAGTQRMQAAGRAPT